MVHCNEVGSFNPIIEKRPQEDCVHTVEQWNFD